MVQCLKLTMALDLHHIKQPLSSRDAAGGMWGDMSPSPLQDRFSNSSNVEEKNWRGLEDL